MKFTSNSALAREYAGASKRMIDEGFEVIEPSKTRKNVADARLGKCDNWEVQYQPDFEDSGYED